MEILCPDCMGPLTTTDGKTARCTLHRGQYEILFLRESVLKPQDAAADVQDATKSLAVEMCLRHPSKQAIATCARCLTPVCAVCGFPQPDGTQLCPVCMLGSEAAKDVAMPGFIRELKGLPSTFEGIMCAQHPAVQAVQLCQACRAAMCATCDFLLPGNVHVCPQCVSRPKRELSDKRKKYLTWSYVCSVWTTIGLIVMLSGVLNPHGQSKADEEALDAIVGFFVYVPSIIGMGLSFAAFDRRLTNPPAVWFAAVWNGLILAFLMLLVVIGIFVR